MPWRISDGSLGSYSSAEDGDVVAVSADARRP
jgi:hypothetical protein